MAIKLKHSDSFSTYFITFTCSEWIPLIGITNTDDMVYKWWAVLKKDYEADVVAYVIMPNHLHVTLHFHKEGFDLNKIVSNGKRFIAYEIIKRVEEKGNLKLLHQLKSLVSDRARRMGQLHKVFKASFDFKAIITQHFLLQKINYIHNNRVTGKWMLAKDFVEYEHSSASFYEIQLVRHFRPLHYLDL